MVGGTPARPRGRRPSRAGAGERRARSSGRWAIVPTTAIAAVTIPVLEDRRRDRADALHDLRLIATASRRSSALASSPSAPDRTRGTPCPAPRSERGSLEPVRTTIRTTRSVLSSTRTTTGELAVPDREHDGLVQLGHEPLHVRPGDADDAQARTGRSPRARRCAGRASRARRRVEAEQADAPERERVAVRRGLARPEPLRQLRKRQLGLLGREEAEHPDGALDRLVDRRVGVRAGSQLAQLVEQDLDDAVGLLGLDHERRRHDDLLAARADDRRRARARPSATGAASQSASSSTPSISPDATDLGDAVQERRRAAAARACGLRSRPHARAAPRAR